MPTRIATLRTYWIRVLIVASIAVTSIGLFLFANDSYGNFTKHVWSPWQAWSSFTASPDDLSVTLPAIWEPSIHHLNDTAFVTEDGKKWEISPEAHRWDSLGKKILIIDVDSRLDLDTGAMLNPDTPQRESMKGRTGGIMNHMFYALVHGYDYRLVRAPEHTDRHGTWVKVSMMRQALKTHDIVIFLDSDAIFENINLPFEWLMSLWNYNEDTLLALAEDPYSKKNSDSKGKVMWNTGFMVGQRSERTHELFQRWEDCPKGERYPECKQWAYDWAHEQAALANHVRYDYNETQDMRVISCNEGNGMPGPHGGSHCNGVFIRHYWFGKDTTVQELYDLLSEDAIRELHSFFHNRIQDYYVDASTLTYPVGDDLVI